MPKSKFEFFNCTSLIIFVTFRTIISTFTGKSWKLSFVKLIHKRTNVCGSASKCKTCSGRGRKRHEQLTHAWSNACCSSFATRSTFSAVCTVFSLLLPILSFVKNFADPVAVHVHEYVYISILLSSTFT